MVEIPHIAEIRENNYNKDFLAINRWIYRKTIVIPKEQGKSLH